jgi:hypothetical protein
MEPRIATPNPIAIAVFKRLYERDLGDSIDAVKLGTNHSYARVYARLALRDRRASLELEAAAQRIRIALGRATVIDPETLEPVRTSRLSY